MYHYIYMYICIIIYICIIMIHFPQSLLVKSRFTACPRIWSTGGPWRPKLNDGNPQVSPAQSGDKYGHDQHDICKVYWLYKIIWSTYMTILENISICDINMEDDLIYMKYKYIYIYIHNYIVNRVYDYRYLWYIDNIYDLYMIHIIKVFFLKLCIYMWYKMI